MICRNLETNKIETKPKINKNNWTSIKEDNGADKKEPEKNFESKGNTIKVTSAGAGLKGEYYDPTKSNYHPINDAFWNHNEK
jgi:hypothetical protein